MSTVYSLIHGRTLIRSMCWYDPQEKGDHDGSGLGQRGVRQNRIPKGDEALMISVSLRTLFVALAKAYSVTLVDNTRSGINNLLWEMLNESFEYAYNCTMDMHTCGAI